MHRPLKLYSFLQKVSILELLSLPSTWYKARTAHAAQYHKGGGSLRHVCWGEGASALGLERAVLVVEDVPHDVVVVHAPLSVVASGRVLLLPVVVVVVVVPVLFRRPK